MLLPRPGAAGRLMAPVVLWHIPISHYNEKVRWALEYKGVEHARKAPPPPFHMAISLALTRGASKTFPLLQLDGQAIGDSSAIIAALEGRYPDPALYPAADADRTRTLELEDFFDKELGPHIRLMAWHELLRDHERAAAVAIRAAPRPLRRFPGAVRRAGGLFVNARYHVGSDDRAAVARDKVLGALDRLEAELGEREYLVGDAFSVADLTAAALFYPLVTPPEGPQVLADPPASWREFRGSLSERRGFQWVAEMFRRHRKRDARVAHATAS
jgi:glutathione S-transferase